MRSSWSPITESIPEPTTSPLLSLGLAGLCVRRRRKSVVLRPYFETR
ncbi:MAG: PEP-CTERM sorting domain-containing protein [Candidatus Competibacteraceae bacterium]|nr:PEP-CTERM sorting domain-containing protein [Candidatus Competibacteraceae bacterium]